MQKFVRFLKWAGISLAVLFLLGIIAIWFFNEKRPVGVTGEKAEALTQKMLQAINKPAWDSTAYVNWTFKGMHTFLWDKERHLTKVTWGDNEVLLDIDKKGGLARKNGELLSAEEAQPTIQKAWEYWCNDSFWLNAPAKALDGGTSRSIVQLEDGREGLMVEYASGGATPGDAYLWLLDENGLPTSYKMWVQIIPVGGVEFTWDQWTTLESGAKVAQFHDGMIDLDISDLKSGKNYQEMGYAADPFAALR